MGLIASLHKTLASGDHWLGAPRSKAWNEKALRIRAAAQAGFAAHGIHAVTFAGLALATGTATETLRRYYLDKDTLLAAVCDAHLQRTDEEVTRADRPDLPAPQRLIALAVAYLDHIQEQGREGQAVWLQARHVLPEAMRADLALRRRWMVGAFADVLGPPEDPHAVPLAEALLAALDAVPALGPAERTERARLLAAMAAGARDTPLPEPAPPPEPAPLPEPEPWPEPAAAITPDDPPEPASAPEPEPPRPPPWFDRFPYTWDEITALAERVLGPMPEHVPDDPRVRSMTDAELVECLLQSIARKIGPEPLAPADDNEALMR